MTLYILEKLDLNEKETKKILTALQKCMNLANYR